MGRKMGNCFLLRSSFFIENIPLTIRLRPGKAFRREVAAAQLGRMKGFEQHAFGFGLEGIFAAAVFQRGDAEVDTNFQARHGWHRCRKWESANPKLR
jgi:hypothetical protein